MTANVKQSIQALESALAKLEAAVERRVQRQSGSDDLQVEIQSLGSDRAQLADRLDKATAKIEKLEGVNRDVSNRLVSAMESVSAVLQAELEEGSDMAEVSIIISGRSYRMACAEGEEDHLTGLGRQLDSTIDELRAGFGEIGDQRLTVMAAILTTDRLHEAEQKILKLEEQLEEARGSGKDFETLNARLVQVLQNAAGRVEQLAGSLDSDRHDPVPQG